MDLVHLDPSLFEDLHQLGGFLGAPEEEDSFEPGRQGEGETPGAEALGNDGRREPPLCQSLLRPGADGGEDRPPQRGRQPIVPEGDLRPGGAGEDDAAGRLDPLGEVCREGQLREGYRGARIGLQPRDRAILSDSSPIVRPQDGDRRLPQPSDRATTSPTTRIAGALDFLLFALSTISPRVSTTTLSLGLHPLSMRAAGVLGRGHPEGGRRRSLRA